MGINGRFLLEISSTKTQCRFFKQLIAYPEIYYNWSAVERYQVLCCLLFQYIVGFLLFTIVGSLLPLVKSCSTCFKMATGIASDKDF